jgi:hypothetical protein
LWQPDFGRPVTAFIDSNIRFAGNKSLKIVSDFQVNPDRYKISGYQDPPKAPNTDYLVRFWARSTGAEAASFFLILDMDDDWNERLYIRKGDYNWTQFARIYNTGPGTTSGFLWSARDREPSGWTTSRLFPSPEAR